MAELFDVADEAMTAAAIATLIGRITIAEGETHIASIVADLQGRSTRWVLSVLPAVVEDATEQTTEQMRVEAPDDSAEQSAALELASVELIEALHNVAEQMGRDARRQIRDGMRLRLETEVAGEPVL